MFRGKIQCIHFVGIGGSGMSGIAEVLLTMGYSITGSDMRDSPVVQRLRALGGTIFLGHAAEHVSEADVVVKSTAVPNSNIEISTALERHIPVIPRAEMLAELMRVKYGIAVAGTHGKTTTTSMVATCLEHAALDPTVVIGGRLNSIGSSARQGSGEFMVAEADESDGSFMLLAPTVAVITNIDPEHMSHWRTEKALVDGFFDFASKVPFFGFAALCIDHPTVRTLVPWMRRRVVTYGLSEDAHVRGVPLSTTGVRTRFAVDVHGKRLGEVELAMPGQHNITNAVAAIAVGLELDIDFETLQNALHGFTGVDRRFSIRAEIGSPSITLIDDYAHHPIEIQATLEAAREAFPSNRIIAVFQPHRFSRVADHLHAFCDSFHHANDVVVLPIYAAGEKPIDRIHHHRLLSGIQQSSCARGVAVESLEESVETLADMAQPGDVIITLGAGTVTNIHSALSNRLERHHAAP